MVFIATVSLALALLRCVHDGLNSLILLDLIGFELLLVFILRVIDSRNFDLVVLYFVVLSLCRLVELVVPYLVITSANAAIINLIIDEHSGVIFDPFLQKLSSSGLTNLLGVGQKVCQVYLRQFIFAPQTNGVLYKSLKVSKQPFQVMIVCISELFVDLLKTH